MTPLNENKIVTPPAWLKFKKEEEKPEEILVFNRRLLYNFDFDDIGFCDNPTFLPALLESAQFMPRSIVEEDDSLIQIIAYTVVECEDRILLYNRGTDIQEQRLAGKLSAGIGGHINPIDALVDNKLAPFNAATRELFEETGVNNPRLLELMGLIYNTGSMVDNVHLGVLFSALLIKKPLITEDFFWHRTTELYKLQFETWSDIALNAIYPCYMNIGDHVKSGPETWEA